MMGWQQGWEQLCRWGWIVLLAMVLWAWVLAGPAWASSPDSGASAGAPKAEVNGDVLVSPSTAVGELSAADIAAIATLREQAFAASQTGQYSQAEQYWGELLDYLPTEAAIWSNRGMVRASQFQLEAAVADYTRAIALAPAAPDPYLNRGAAYEMMQNWEAAIADYNQVLALDPNEAGAYNNRGNAKAGLGDWAEAITDYRQAADLDPEFALARVNYGLAQYQVGDSQGAIKTLRSVVRRYPNFADARAALTAALWVGGQWGEAESHWVAVSGLDQRYKDMDWIRTLRRWPPAAADALAQFLTLEG